MPLPSYNRDIDPTDPSFDPDAPLLDIHTDSLVRWVDDVPHPTVGKSLAKQQLAAVQLAMLSAPYLGTYNPDTGLHEIEPGFENTTNFTAAALKLAMKAASGDVQAYNAALDRVIGKPKQAVESVNMSMSYTEWLDANVDALKEYEDTYSNTIDVTHYNFDDETEDLLRDL